MSDLVQEFERTMFMSLSELKKSYRKVSLLLHSDICGSEDAFKKLNAIYAEGLVWFKKSFIEFLYVAPYSDVTQVVKGTPAVRVPTFTKDGFPIRWARQLVTGCELMYEFHQTEHGDFPVQALQFVINSVCRLKAYYEAWLEFGASPTIQLAHFAQSWNGILHLSTLILEMNMDSFDPFAPELTAAFAHVQYSVVDITDIKIMGEVHLEKMFGDEVWIKATPPPNKKTFTEQELEQFANEAKAETEAEAVALSLISSEQAIALTKMGKQMQELKQAKKNAELDMKVEISKTVKKMNLMENQFTEQLDQVYGERGNQPNNPVLHPLGFPIDLKFEATEKEKTIIRRSYDFFDSININEHGEFSVRDAMYAAYTMQYPNASQKEIEKQVKNGVRNSRRQLTDKTHIKRMVDGTQKETAADGYQPYSVVTRLLLSRSHLTEFCDMITSLAARELAPSPIRIAVLMLHLKDISNGNINVNVAYNVLGLCNGTEKERYLLDLCAFSDEKTMCMEMVKTKHGTQQRCAHLVMRGKDMCSHHVRDLKFQGQIHVPMVECKKSIYMFRIVNSDIVKVGYSSNVDHRRTNVQTCCPFKIYVEFSALVNDAQQYESVIKAHLTQQGKHISGEWFRLPLPVDAASLLRECGLQ